MIDYSLILKNQTIAVAVSGGMDSMCLLHILLSCREKYNLTIKAINIDHSIRGKDSENDSLFVKDYCEKNGVELKFFKVDAVNFSKENKYTLEQGARILRYKIFNDLLTENYADKIATAHHLNDNFESVLLNIFRGSGLKGLAGINPCDNNFIRPLLNVSKQQIKEYIEKNNIPFVEDSTNSENDYSRNYIRNVISPLIEEKFPSSPLAIKRLSDIAREENEFLENLAKSYVNTIKNGYYISIDTPPALFKRAIIIALNLCGLEKDYEKTHIEDIYKLLSLENGSKITLPKNIIAVKEYDKISFYQRKNSEKIKELPFAVKSYKFKDFTLDFKKDETLNSLRFDKDKIPDNTVIRNRKNGDIFTKFGGGTKKLKDYLIDKKIPLVYRDELIVLASGNEILMIVGVEISDKIKVDKNTKNPLYAVVDN